MKQKFEVILLGDVWDFLDTLDEKSKKNLLQYRQIKVC